jgi:hypothetical protein
LPPEAIHEDTEVASACHLRRPDCCIGAGNYGKVKVDRETAEQETTPPGTTNRLFTRFGGLVDADHRWMWRCFTFLAAKQDLDRHFSRKLVTWLGTLVSRVKRTDVYVDMVVYHLPHLY